MEEIRWADRVEPGKIRRLYQADAAGRPDEGLLEEVGYAFLARAESILATNRIHLEGVAACPACAADVPRRGDRYDCPCGWGLDASALHKSYKGKQFIGPSIVDFARKFIADWNAALGEPGRRMAAIDFLIHRFHWEMTEAPTRPVAINYIKGNIGEIKALILGLAGEPGGERQANRDSWLNNSARSDDYWNARAKE